MIVVNLKELIQKTIACVYGISKWTNSSRASARHIDNGNGFPLCGGNGRKAFCWELEIAMPTCKKCIRLRNTAYAVGYKHGKEDQKEAQNA